MWRVFVSIGILFCGGVLGASGLIVGKKPNAKDLIDKLVPYQGWIGIVLFFWGIWDVIYVLQSLGIISAAPILFIIILATAATELLLGFLLGFGLLSKWALSKNETAMAKGQAIRLKLSGIQGILGLIAIGLAVFYLIWILFV